MDNSKSLIVSICIFIIIGMSALLLILNKGHIGNFGLVSLNDVADGKEEVIMPKLEISTEKKYLSIKDKETSKILATVDGENVTTGIEYTTSDKNIAKVVNGEIVPVKDGKVTITGKYQGQSSSVDIYVITPVKNMTFTTTNSSIRVGKELQMKLQVTPSDANINTLKYTSSDESIATVNSNGIVTGVSEGKVTITVKDEYTGLEKSVNLTIKK